MKKYIVKLAVKVIHTCGYYAIAVKKGEKIETIGYTPLKHYTDVESFFRFKQYYDEGRF